MAAVLKKRVIAEYTQVIQQEAKPPPKKLRLSHKTKAAEVHLDLQSTATSHDALQALVRLEESLPITAEHAGQIIQTLIDHFYKEKETYVRAKLAMLIGTLAKAPGFSGAYLVQEISPMIKSEKSHTVLAQLVSTLMTIGQSMPQDKNLHGQLTNITRQNLKDTNHVVRCKCLQLIGALGSPDQKPPDDSQSDTLQQLLQRFTEDDDPRVRGSAFQAMLGWHQRGIKLEQTMYDHVCRALTDDYEGVRVAALKLVWVLSQLYPESTVQVPESDEGIRLIDDGFAKVCNMVNDLSMMVRAEAARLLGSLHQVSPRFLEQTLDKKLMSNMRRKRSAHERQKEHFESGEWSSGQKWADDAPREEVESDAVSLMSSGACGAFVHGLEDEYLEVRNAAIDSLCELATQSRSFASLSQDFLVDMFNDEIEAVRLNAINSLRKITHHLLIREDQLEIILGVLKDFNFEIREALQELFCCSKLGTKNSLNSCIMGLLDNLKRYPQDRTNVWRCMQQLGKRHPALTLPLVAELLSIHPYFDSPEPDMDDPAYISILILVFNAAKDSPTMPTLLPEHTRRHYAYLRDTLPDLVPKLQLPGMESSPAPSTSGQQMTASSFLDQTLQRLTALPGLDNAASQELMQMTIRDLERVCQVEPDLSATAECLSLFLQCQLCLAKLTHGNQWSAPALLTPHQTSLNSSLIDRVISLSFHMENLFVGLGVSDLITIRQVRLRAQTLELLSKLRTNTSEHKSDCVHYLQGLSQLQRMLTTNKITANKFTQALLSQMPRLESCDPQVFLSVLQSMLGHHKPTMLQPSNQVQRARAILVEPTGNSDTTYKFTAGFTTAVPLIANLENIEHVQNVRIQVKYPDQQSQLIIPRASEFRQLSPLRHRLVAQVLLTHSIWSEVCPVEIGVVLCYNPDKDIHGDKPESARIEANTKHVLELCKPVKVLVSPKPAKR